METADAWQQLFENWPDNLPRTGILVTTFQETIPFIQFLVTPGLLAVQRDRPDSIGGRKVLLAFSAISAVKMTDTEDFMQLKKLGFC